MIVNNEVKDTRAYELMKHYIPVQTARKIKENGEFLIVSNSFGTIYYLNDVAHDIWVCINNENTIENIFAKILNIYDANEDYLKADIMELIRDLQWNKLIRLKE